MKNICLFAPLILIHLFVGFFMGGNVYKTKDDRSREFLIELYTIDDPQLGAPTSQYAEYLQENFGAYCEQEALDTLLASRFPFSFIEQGLKIEVKDVQTKTFESINEGSGIKVTYQVFALCYNNDGTTEYAEFTGRLTLNPENGMICAIRIDHLGK